MTARDLIYASLRLIGVISPGQTPSNDQAQDALYSLNSIISTWRTEKLMVYATLPHQFPLVASQKTYTVGPGGNFDMPRPVRIDKITLQYLQTGVPTLTLPVGMLDLDQYNAIIVPDTTSTIPMSAYVDDAYPLRTLYLYPVPSIVNKVTLFTWEQLDAFASLDDDVSLPDGYERALRFALAVELAPEFGRDPLQTVIANAVAAKASVMTQNNADTPLMQVDPAAQQQKPNGTFNYLTGE